MKIDLKKEDKKLTIKLGGKLDTNTSPELDSKMNELEGMEEVIIDMKELDYISSAGLRVLLSMQKVMNKQGKMTIINVCENVMDIFEVTGFSDILDIEE
jgi:anti-sigma B factor antagonist